MNFPERKAVPPPEEMVRDEILKEYSLLLLSIHQLRNDLTLTPYKSELSPRQEQSWTYTIGPDLLDSVMLPPRVTQRLGRINSVSISGDSSVDYSDITVNIYDKDTVYRSYRTADGVVAHHEDVLFTKREVSYPDGSARVTWDPSETFSGDEAINNEEFYNLVLSTVIDDVALRVIDKEDPQHPTAEFTAIMKEELRQKASLRDREDDIYDFETDEDTGIIFTEEAGGFLNVTVRFGLPDGRIAIATHKTNEGLKITFEVLQEEEIGDVFGGTKYRYTPFIPTSKEVLHLRTIIEKELNAHSDGAVVALNSTDTRGTEDPSAYVQRSASDSVSDFLLTEIIDPGQDSTGAPL